MAGFIIFVGIVNLRDRDNIVFPNKSHRRGFGQANAVTAFNDGGRINFENWAEFAESRCLCQFGL
jgi:hypothetical protein